MVGAGTARQALFQIIKLVCFWILIFKQMFWGNVVMIFVADGERILEKARCRFIECYLYRQWIDDSDILNVFLVLCRVHQVWSTRDQGVPSKLNIIPCERHAVAPRDSLAKL